MGRTIAVLTGGGDCPGLNAVIRGIVRSATMSRDWRVLGILDGFEGLIEGPHTMPLDLEAVRGLLPRGGTILGTSNRGNPLAYPVADGDHVCMVDVTDRVIGNFHRTGADGLVVIGGDGTLKIAQRLYEQGLPVVAVPKTIDNDLKATDVTFGYHTAVATVTEALDRLHSTAESHHRVIVVEVMGRYAGWIALESGIAGSADIILIPEIPYRIETVCDAIEARRKRGSRFSIVVVAEGASPVGGDRVTKVSADANQGVERLGGIGARVADEIAAGSGAETRVVVLGHVQRGGSPSHTDRILGSRFGVKAVELLAAGRTGRMVSLQGRAVTSVPIAEAVGSLNLVDAAGELPLAAEELGISLGR